MTRNTEDSSRFLGTTIAMAAGGALIGATFGDATGAVFGGAVAIALNVYFYISPPPTQHAPGGTNQ